MQLYRWIAFHNVPLTVLVVNEAGNPQYAIRHSKLVEALSGCVRRTLPAAYRVDATDSIPISDKLLTVETAKLLDIFLESGITPIWSISKENPKIINLKFANNFNTFSYQESELIEMTKGLKFLELNPVEFGKLLAPLFTLIENNSDFCQLRKVVGSIPIDPQSDCVPMDTASSISSDDEIIGGQELHWF